MADNFLPPDYQSDIDAAQRRLQLAQMLQQRGMNLEAPQAQGAQAARISPFSAIASALSGAGGGYFANQAQGDIQNVRKRYATDEAADIAKLQGLAEPEAIKAGQVSQFPRSREIAKTMQTQAEKRRELLSGVYGTAGQVPRAEAVLTGQPIPAAQPPKMPEYGTVAGPEGKPLPILTNFDKYGIPTGRLGAQGTAVNVNTNLPNEEGKMVVSQLAKNLDERRAKAEAAKSTYAAANQALDALESGAGAGGGEAFKQTARKAAQAFGIQLPETASTEQLSMALLQGVIGQAKNLRPASDTDLKILQQMAGSVGTDPTALSKALAFAQSMAIQDLQGYSQYAAENQKSLVPEVQNLFRGATSGYEVPKTLTGPTSYQMEVMRNLQRNGVDISQFLDPSGQPFPANAKFNIAPAKGFPGVEQKAEPNTAGPNLNSFLPPKRINTEAEYNALPPGSRYTAPDGSTRTKGAQ